MCRAEGSLLLAGNVSPFIPCHMVYPVEDKRPLWGIQAGFCGNLQDLCSRAASQLLLFALVQGVTAQRADLCILLK